MKQIHLLLPLLLLTLFTETAYASSYTNYFNGTAIRTFDKGTTVHETPPPCYTLNLVNTTWTMYNSTSGSVGTISFHGKSWNDLIWVRHLNGHTNRGYLALPPSYMITWRPMNLCSIVPYPKAPTCALLNSITISPDHMEFKDSHGGIIDMILSHGNVIVV